MTLNNLFLLIATAVRGRFPQTRHLWKRTSVGERVGRFFARRLEVVAFAGLLRLSLCVLGGVDFFVFLFSDIFFLRMHTACCECEAALPQLPPYYLHVLP